MPMFSFKNILICYLYLASFTYGVDAASPKPRTSQPLSGITTYDVLYNALN